VTEQWQNLSRPPLRQAALRRALTTDPDPAWRSIDVVPVTGSTNADLAERAGAGEPEGAVLVADHQTAGRGRRDRRWTAPPRAGLAVSVLLRPASHGVPPDRWSWLTLMAGVAVTDALIRTFGLPATLKWPNDVLVPVPGTAEPGKVAGLLAEVVRTGGDPWSGPGSAGSGPGSGGPAVVVGLGINVTQDDDELPVPTATSLKLAGSATTDRDTVLRAVLRALAERYREFVAAAGEPANGSRRPPGPFRPAAAYRERCSTIGRLVRAQLPDGTTLTGLADGVDDEGRLLIREHPEAAAGRVHSLSAGDVVHIRASEPA
jgi:BirA family transcriptional regulator, biotin operon repressor / biotin---[acetyl-CoA-carboxylase] ligase